MYHMTYFYSEPITHHGIQGQKWGIRRFTNPDGTLTEEGKKRYKKIPGTDSLPERDQYYENDQKRAWTHDRIIDNYVKEGRLETANYLTVGVLGSAALSAAVSGAVTKSWVKAGIAAVAGALGGALLNARAYSKNMKGIKESAREYDSGFDEWEEADRRANG